MAPYSDIGLSAKYVSSFCNRSLTVLFSNPSKDEIDSFPDECSKYLGLSGEWYVPFLFFFIAMKYLKDNISLIWGFKSLYSS